MQLQLEVRNGIMELRSVSTSALLAKNGVTEDQNC